MGGVLSYTVCDMSNLYYNTRYIAYMIHTEVSGILPILPPSRGRREKSSLFDERLWGGGTEDRAGARYIINPH